MYIILFSNNPLLIGSVCQLTFESVPIYNIPTSDTFPTLTITGDFNNDQHLDVGYVIMTNTFGFDPDR